MLTHEEMLAAIAAPFNMASEQVMPEALPDGSTAKKAKRDCIQWTERMAQVFFKEMKKEKFFSRTVEVDQRKKWAMISSALQRHPFFVQELGQAGVSKVTPDSCEGKFKSVKTYVEKKYAVDKEGANLSGLEELDPDSSHANHSEEDCGAEGDDVFGRNRLGYEQKQR